MSSNQIEAQNEEKMQPLLLPLNAYDEQRKKTRVHKRHDKSA